jgi:hypothetical protein
MPFCLTDARPIVPALLGMLAMVGVLVAYDPSWFVWCTVLLTVNYTVWGLLYFAGRQG